MDQKEIVQIIIQGGAVGLCALLIIQKYLSDKMYNRTINNHLEHSNRSDIQLAENLKGLSDSIETSNKVTEKLLDRLMAK